MSFIVTAWIIDAWLLALPFLWLLCWGKSKNCKSISLQHSKVPSQSFGCIDLSTHTWRCRSTNYVARRLACSSGDIKLSFQVLWMLWILTAVCLICIHVRVFMLLSCIGQRSLSNSGVLEGLLNLLDSLLSPLQQPQAAAQRRTEGKATENSVFAAPDMLTWVSRSYR